MEDYSASRYAKDNPRKTGFTLITVDSQVWAINCYSIRLQSKDFLLGNQTAYSFPIPSIGGSVNG